MNFSRLHLMGNQMIIGLINKNIKPGIVIPKPRARSDFIVKGWGIRRGETALIYYIPNNSNPEKPYQKGITISEFEIAYRQLIENDEFNHQWFAYSLYDCCKEGSCNFTTIGGIFELLGLAFYSEIGVYSKL